MEINEIDKIVSENIRALMWALNVQTWTVKVVYDSLSSDQCTTAQVEFMNNYERATVTIDPLTIKNESALLNALRHELIHLQHTPYQVAKQTLWQFIDSQTVQTAMQQVWQYSMEKTVLHTENMLDNLGLSAEKLIEIGKSKIERWDGSVVSQSTNS